MEGILISLWIRIATLGLGTKIGRCEIGLLSCILTSKTANRDVDHSTRGTRVPKDDCATNVGEDKGNLEGRCSRLNNILSKGLEVLSKGGVRDRR
ncbi:hypothetical protein F4804DRAFT_312608 [Jackrogersella minutella]|nr:hypothetical protein F4804DRAFT_312608 [Jackrogersella minutella]